MLGGPVIATEDYRLKSPPRLRTRPWIRLSIRPSTRSHRSPAFRFCSASGVEEQWNENAR